MMPPPHRRHCELGAAAGVRKSGLGCSLANTAACEVLAGDSRRSAGLEPAWTARIFWWFVLLSVLGSFFLFSILPVHHH